MHTLELPAMAATQTQVFAKIHSMYVYMYCPQYYSPKLTARKTMTALIVVFLYFMLASWPIQNVVISVISPHILMNMNMIATNTNFLSTVLRDEDEWEVCRLNYYRTKVDDYIS